MGTTLTGTTPQDTYDSLIKVTDNGPLSGTLKALSDGLGNDSTLSLSTTAASIAGTLAVTGNATFDTTTLFVDAANNRVGILTNVPAEPLHVEGNIMLAYGSSLKAANATYKTLIETGYNGTSDFVSLYTAGNNIGNATAKITMLANGNVGIGTSAPTELLHLSTTLGGSTGVGTAIQITSAGAGGDQAFIGVNKGAGNGLELSVENRDIIFNTGATTPFGGTERFRITANGVTFNGDTAAANALDDYEEGTFTPTATSGITITTIYNATYTKIGNTVTFQIWLFASVTSANFVITGLPFTTSGRTACSLSSISLGQSISNQIVSTDIYGYGATPFVGNEIFIGGVYRVA